jgi:hypothetical protein
MTVAEFEVCEPPLAETVSVPSVPLLVYVNVACPAPLVVLLPL